MNLPVGNPPPPPVPPTVVTIDVDFDGTISWNGDVVANEDALQQHMRDAAAANPQPEIHLNPNKLATYKYVAHVMADAQRLGVHTLGLVGN
jgi:biopolymer transport protein ExbD